MRYWEISKIGKVNGIRLRGEINKDSPLIRSMAPFRGPPQVIE